MSTTTGYDMGGYDGTTPSRDPLPYLTTLAEKVRPADSPEEVWNEAFNAGRDAVLTAARVTRNPLAGVLSGAERQVVVALFNKAYEDRSLNHRLLKTEQSLAQVNAISEIARKLGLHLDA